MNINKYCGTPNNLVTQAGIESDVTEEQGEECYTLTLQLTGSRQFSCGTFTDRVEAIRCGLDLVTELRNIVPLVHVTITDQRDEMIFAFNQVL